MCNTVGFQGIANQNHSEIVLHIAGMAIMKVKKWKIKSVGKALGRLVPSQPAAETGKMQQFLRKLDVALPYYPAIPLLGVYPKELETCSHKILYTPCSQQHCACQPKSETSPHVPQVMNRQGCGWCTQKMYIPSLLTRRGRDVVISTQPGGINST